MNWGIVSLAPSWFENGLSGLVYGIEQFFMGLFYMVWRTLAIVVDWIESIFRNLAGIGGNQVDIASSIIQSKSVEMIFGNMVAVATALLIFFTIIKIIQDHYKEKEGGNPYMIVFRMFKGMLMFFFVTAAVLVGIYASGVVFRALDYATGGKEGSTTISGQIFRSMAQNANRLRIGEPGTDGWTAAAREAQYRLLAPVSNLDDEAYVVVKCSGEPVSGAALESKLNDFGVIDPSEWLLVSPSGSVSTFGSSIKVDEETGRYEWDSDNNIYTGGEDAWKQNTGKFDYNKDLEDGVEAWGSAGYKNDFLAVFHPSICPQLSLDWSPIEKWRYVYSFVEDTGEIDTSPSFNGNKFPAGYKNVYLKKTDMQEVSLDKDAQAFSINLNAGVSLQGDEAAASFSFEAFASEKPLNKILAKIVGNMALTKGVMSALGAMSNLKMPLIIHVFSLVIPLTQLAAVMLQPLLELFLTSGIDRLFPGDEEELVQTKNEVSEWVKWDSSQAESPITISAYEFDTNFEDLWSQLADNWQQLHDLIMKESDMIVGNYDNAIREIDSLVGDQKQQVAWAAWRGYVDHYNEQVKKYLTELGNLFKVYDAAPNTANSKDILATYNQLLDAWSTYYKQERDLKPNPSIYSAWSSVGHIYHPAFVPAEKEETVLPEGTTADSIRKKLTSATYNLRQYTTSNGNRWVQKIDWECFGTDIASSGAARYDELLDYGTSSYDWRGSSGAISTINYLTTMSNGIKIPNGTVEYGQFHTDGVYYGGTSRKDPKAILVPDTFKKALENAKTSALTASHVNSNGDVVRRSLGAGTASSIYAADADFNKIRNNDTTKVSELTTQTLEKMGMVTLRKKSTVGTMDDPNGTVDPNDEANMLKKWVHIKSNRVPLADATIQMANEYSPAEIDNLMTRQNSEREYLMVSESPAGAFTKQENISTYVGQFTYNDRQTVKALYELGEVQWYIGFAGIIVAIGVYVNFTFGLIQRAINMAVLYVMSPITIAFYPFDDGAKFNSAFVKPFYQQTISVFAVVISLNMWLVLFGPLLNAVSAATGGSTIMRVLAIISFLSMLPSIRKSITQLLGAGELQEKKLSQMAMDAGKALGGKKWVTAAKFGADWRDRNARTAPARREKMDKLKSAVAKKLGENNWIKKRMEASQAKKKALADEVDAWRKNPTGVQLSKAGRRLAKLQDKQVAADRMAGKLDYERDLVVKAKAGDKAAEAKLAAARREAKAQGISVDSVLEKESHKNARSGWAKAANGVVSFGKKAWNAPGKVMRGTKTLTAGITSGIQKAMKYSKIGNAFETIFHPATGMLAQAAKSNPNSVAGMIGGAIQYVQPGNRRKRWEEQDKAEAEWRAAKNEIETIKQKCAMDSGEFILQGERSRENSIKEIAASKQAMADGMKKAYLHLATKDLVAQGGDEATARALAEESWNNMDAQARQAAFDKLGGMHTYQTDLLYGRAGAQIRNEFIQSATRDFDAMAASNDEESLKQQVKSLNGEQKGAIRSLVKEFQHRNGLTLSAEQSKQLESAVIAAVGDNESIEGIAGKMAVYLPKDKADTKVIVGDLLNSNFAAQVAQMKFDLQADNAMVNGVLTYKKKLQSADDAIYQEMNIHTNSAEYQDFLKIYRQMYDPNAQNGVIAQEKRLLEKYNGDASNPDYIRELDNMSKSVSSKFDAAIKALGKNADTQAYEYGTKRISEQQAEFNVELGKEFLTRLDYHTSVNMTDKARDTVLNDNMLHEMELNGNVHGAAIKLQTAVEAAKRQDFEAVRATGLNEATVQKFMQMSKSTSGMKDLQSMYDLADLKLKFFGNMDAEMSGAGTRQAQNALTALYQVTNSKYTMDQLKQQLNSNSSQQASLLNALDMLDLSIENTLDGAAFELMQNKYLQLTDEFGNLVKGKEFGKFARRFLQKVKNMEITENDPKYVEVYSAINRMANDWESNPDLAAIMKGNAASAKLNAFIGGLDKAVRMNQLQRQNNLYNERVGQMDAKLWAIMKKGKYFGDPSKG